MPDEANRTATPGPRPHGVRLDRDRRGNPRVSVTHHGKRGGPGRPIRTLTGQRRDLAYPYLSSILYDHTGRRFAFDAQEQANGRRGEFHAISEDAAVHMLLLMDAVRAEPEYNKAKGLAEAIASMNHCEAAWWYAHHCNRGRPRRVLRALALMYG